jgi:hypothetical protein
MPPPRPPVQTLPEPAPGIVSIRLQSLDLLFNGPAIDPFAGSHDGHSGMDHLQLALKRHWSRDTPDVHALRLIVPAAEATAGRLADTRQAIAGWCDAQVGVTRNLLSVMAKERRRAWQVGGLFFALCFAIAAALETHAAIAGKWGTLLSETIIIAGWVGVWHPLDLTLYAWWPHRFRLQMLEKVRQLEVSLLPDAPDESHRGVPDAGIGGRD